MTTSKPPKYLSSIFNSFYYAEDVTTGFTQAEADLRYLKKNITDTATALETFSGGIITNSIESVISTDTINIATGSRDGPINIGTALTATGVMTIGSLTGSIVKFGSSALTTQITPSTSSMNISNVGPANGDFNLCPQQNSGVLNIGTSTIRTAAINIATTKNSSLGQAINIGSSSTLATGQIININRPLTIGYTPVALTNFNQIGNYSHSSGSSSATITSGNNYLVHSVSSIPDGTYNIIGNITCLGTGCTITLQEFGITTVTPPIPTGALTYYNSASVKTSTSFIPANGTYIVNFNTVCQITGGTIFLSQNTTYTNGAFSLQGRLIIVRIG